MHTEYAHNSTQGILPTKHTLSHSLVLILFFDLILDASPLIHGEFTYLCTNHKIIDSHILGILLEATISNLSNKLTSQHPATPLE